MGDRTWVGNGRVNELAAKLAAAHVSHGTFPDEAAADAIVQPIAVKAFTNGLKDPKAQFFLKARNPGTLTKAISDALEVNTTDNEETAMWVYAGPSRYKPQHTFRGRGNYHRPRGNFRGRFNNNQRGNYQGRGRYQDRYQNENNYQRNNENNNHNNNNYPQNNRGNNRGRQRHANVVAHEPQQQQQQRQNAEEEDVANVIDLFRD